MFTGLVEETGELLALTPQPNNGVRLALRTKHIAKAVQLGESVAVNGCCLTVAARQDDVLFFDLLQETLARTSIRSVPQGGRVNLERALTAGGRLGGHFVQGHVDGTTEILRVQSEGADVRVEVALPAAGAPYLVPKGSIAVDGISLTVSELQQDRFVLWIIPHTLLVTNLGERKAGDLVNLEYDLLAKYVERQLAHRAGVA